MSEMWTTIASERRSLADDLSDLRGAGWAARSLCGEWTVQDVLAQELHHVSARTEGLTLKANDTDWTHGSGPVVKGPALWFLLAATGRGQVCPELTGDGLEALRQRAR